MEIRVKGLTRDYFSEGKRIRALDHVDLTIPANRIFTLLGPSGCGKTTLLRCIVGLEVPDSGEIAIGDEVVFSKDRDIFVPPEKRGLGMVFQTYAIWPTRTSRHKWPTPQCAMCRRGDRSRVAGPQVRAARGFENRPAPRLSGSAAAGGAGPALVAEPKEACSTSP